MGEEWGKGELTFPEHHREQCQNCDSICNYLPPNPGFITADHNTF